MINILTIRTENQSLSANAHQQKMCVCGYIFYTNRIGFAWSAQSLGHWLTAEALGLDFW